MDGRLPDNRGTRMPRATYIVPHYGVERCGVSEPQKALSVWYGVVRCGTAYFAIAYSTEMYSLSACESQKSERAR